MFSADKGDGYPNLTRKFKNPSLQRCAEKIVVFLNMWNDDIARDFVSQNKLYKNYAQVKIQSYTLWQSYKRPSVS